MRRFVDQMLHPGERLVMMHCASYFLYHLRYMRWLGLLIWNVEVFLSSCHISVKCKIPKTTVFPHPVGIVIGDGVTIKDYVTIYQNVTLGARKVGGQEYPVIEQGTVIYAGSILVGDYRTNANASIAAMSFLKG
jgi:serine O-acetyltransferase